ncbi:MAG: hypothetical protein JRG91_21210 [Deltaproteobacteria bacterium]|nr:hypothetical protein [Deltaproteobacteria bacterium]
MMIVLAAAGAQACSGCEEKDDRKAILAIIHEAAEMAQEHRTSDLMDLTTSYFTAHGSDRQEVRGVLMYAWNRYGKFRIMYPEPGITVAPDRMTAKAKVPFVILREGGPIPDLGGLAADPQGWLEEASKSADPYHLELWFAKSDDGWKVEKAVLDGVRPMGSI